MLKFLLFIGLVIGALYYVNPAQTKKIAKNAKSIVKSGITVVGTVTDAANDALNEATSEY